MCNIEKAIEKVEAMQNQIDLLQKPIAEELFKLQKLKDEAEEKANELIYKSCISDLQGNDYGCGTANIETPQYKIKTVVSKNVKWDEQELRNVANQIRSAGQDPETYITYKLSVSETNFKKFPESIQAAFYPARTVEPSAPKITWERK